MLWQTQLNHCMNSIQYDMILAQQGNIKMPSGKENWMVSINT